MPATAFTTSQAIATGNARYVLGWSIAETAGAQAKVRILDGTSSAGTIIASINLAANESVRDILTPEMSLGTSGSIYVQVLAGAVEGAVWYA